MGYLRKLVVAALSMSLFFIAFTSYGSADEFNHQNIETVEVSDVNEVTSQRFKAVANGLKYWGKQAVKMFFDNGGGASINNEVSNAELESAFD